MSEYIPSESGDYGDDNEPSLETTTADFIEWERELADNPQLAELVGKLGELSLGETVKMSSDELISFNEEVSEVKIDEQPEQIQYDSLNLESSNNPVERSRLANEAELFSAAMGIIYFTTGIPVDEVFEE